MFSPLVVAKNFCRLDGLVPNTPLPRANNSTAKRKAAFETPSVPKVPRANGMSSPSDSREDSKNTP